MPIRNITLAAGNFPKENSAAGASKAPNGILEKHLCCDVVMQIIGFLPYADFINVTRASMFGRQFMPTAPDHPLSGVFPSQMDLQMLKKDILTALVRRRAHNPETLMREILRLFAEPTNRASRYLLNDEAGRNYLHTLHPVFRSDLQTQFEDLIRTGQLTIEHLPNLAQHVHRGEVPAPLKYRFFMTFTPDFIKTLTNTPALLGVISGSTMIPFGLIASGIVKRFDSIIDPLLLLGSAYIPIISYALLFDAIVPEYLRRYGLPDGR